MPGNATSLDLSGVSPVYYAPATIASTENTLQVSGQIGTSSDGKFPDDYESQILLALTNLRKVLVAAGARVADITKLTLYIVNYDPKRRVHVAHLQKFLGGHRPAMTLVPVAQLALDGLLFEVDATVALSPPTAAASARTQDPRWVDVVVVGAGLSGLAAARDVTSAGFSCIVLEARDRVGGKTWTKKLKDGSGNVDLGAAWINDTNQSRVFALAQQYGAELIEQNTTGNCSFQDAEGSCSPFAYGDLPPVR
jgi:monoamine oxidase